ncbi:MAG: gas vesicle protein GvpD [Anaerosomatales bacterium]|nr:gas vesicle protein GvpD [Anaerosomatales bacterium]
MGTERIPSGVPGLDELLGGGLIPRRSYLVRGGPGTGKTMLSQQFLAEGVRQGEASLAISLEEAEEQYRADATAAGVDLSGVEILDLSALPESFAEDQAYDLFSPAEVERGPTTTRIVEVIERLRPARVVIDSMTRFRMYATNPYAFRRQVDAFVRYLTSAGATVLFISEAIQPSYDYDLCFLADGTFTLEVDAELRTIQVDKFRGGQHRTGRHAFKIGDGGIRVFPRLVPGNHGAEFARQLVPSGIPELDRLLSGGIERGLVTMISGPSGAGKTTLGMQFLMGAVAAGERVALFAFEEPVATMTARCTALGMPIQGAIDSGALLVRSIEPLQVSSDELAAEIVEVVSQAGRTAVMLDSVAAYRLALRGDDLVERLHSLCRYLGNMGCTVILVNEVTSVGSGLRFTEAGLSYLADNLIYLTYFEDRSSTGSRVARAVTVAKKRVSAYDDALYELVFGDDGIMLRGPLVARGFVEGAVVVDRDE